MGDPVRIVDLARSLLWLSGKSEQEIGIRFKGLRDGEKISEEFSYATEEIHPTAFPKIKRVRGTPNRWHDLQRHLVQLRTALSAHGAAAIRAEMKKIVPEYSPGLEDSREDALVPEAPEMTAAARVAGPQWPIGHPVRYSTHRF